MVNSSPLPENLTSSLAQKVHSRTKDSESGLEVLQSLYFRDALVCQNDSSVIFEIKDDFLSLHLNLTTKV